MENVLSAVIIVFILLFGVASLSYTAITTQDTLGTARLAQETRLADQARTALAFVTARTIDNRTVAELTLRNAGSTRMAAFERWDVIVKYTDEAGITRVEYLAHGGKAPGWQEELVLDAAIGIPEALEPGIFNAGEELVLRAATGAVIQEGSGVEVSVTTEHGVGLLAGFAANRQPALLTNEGLLINRNEPAAPITPAHLLSEDPDPHDEVTFTITGGELSGGLSLSSFTQADIDAGLVTYNRLLSADGESFTFSLSDGKDTVEGYTFTITVNELPVYAPSLPHAVVTDGASIPEGSLTAYDPDEMPEPLRYTLTVPPMTGNLRLGGAAMGTGAAFTLADVSAGRLTYHVAGEVQVSDSFSFELTDGHAVVGPYTVALIAPEG